MQLIGEAYNLFRDALGFDAEQVADVFHRVERRRSRELLVEITAEVLRQKDAKTGKALVDVIVDAAEQKGTGRWTVNPHWIWVCRSPASPSRLRPCAVRSREQRKAAQGLRPVSWAPSRPMSRSSPRTSAARCTRRRSSRTRRASTRSVPAATSTAGPDARRHGHDLARWLHHPRPLPHRIKEAYDTNPELTSLIVEPYFREAHRERDRQLASGCRHGDHAGYPGAGVRGRRCRTTTVCAPSVCRPH